MRRTDYIGASLFFYGGSICKMCKIDEVDKRLIELLQDNARTPLKLLASKVFLSAPAVSSRIEKLEKNGIINGYNICVDNQKLGYHITAFVSLELPASRKDEFYEFIRTCSNVLECNCVTGSYSMLLKVAFHSTQELDGFVDELQYYGNTSTQIVFSTPVPHREIRLT